MVVRKRPKPLLIGLIICSVILIVGGSFLGYLSLGGNYHSTDTIEVDIPSGMSSRNISKLLKKKGVIRSEVLFTVSVQMHHNSLKAGTYRFQGNMSLAKVIKTLEKGSNYNPNMVVLTFKEGERITDYAKVIANGTNYSYEEVIEYFKNREIIKNYISKYWFLSDAILDANIYYPLEGYLAPDTYHFDNKDVELEEIILTMLDENKKKLSSYQKSLEGNVHKFLTMASIVELEGTNTENRKMIVGIFNNRLSSGMNMGSDVTSYYGLQIPMSSDLNSAQFADINPYNTRSTTMIGKMPVGPICNPSISSIEASIEPTDSDYLFFVADKKGNIYYTKTMVEHDQKVAEIKAKGDWIW